MFLAQYDRASSTPIQTIGEIYNLYFVYYIRPINAECLLSITCFGHLFEENNKIYKIQANLIKIINLYVLIIVCLDCKMEDKRFCTEW